MSFDFLKNSGNPKPELSPVLKNAPAHSFSQEQINQMNADRQKLNTDYATQVAAFGGNLGKKQQKGYDAFQEHMGNIQAANDKRMDPAQHTVQAGIGPKMTFDDLRGGRGYGSRGPTGTPAFQMFPHIGMNPDRRSNPGFSVPATGLFGLRY